MQTKMSKSSAGVEPEQIFHSWMHDSYLKLIQELLHLMKAHHNQDVQVIWCSTEHFDIITMIGEVFLLSNEVSEG